MTPSGVGSVSLSILAHLKNNDKHASMKMMQNDGPGFAFFLFLPN